MTFCKLCDEFYVLVEQLYLFVIFLNKSIIIPIIKNIVAVRILTNTVTLNPVATNVIISRERILNTIMTNDLKLL